MITLQDISEKELEKDKLEKTMKSFSSNFKSRMLSKFDNELFKQGDIYFSLYGGLLKIRPVFDNIDFFVYLEPNTSNETLNITMRVLSTREFYTIEEQEENAKIYDLTVKFAKMFTYKQVLNYVQKKRKFEDDIADLNNEIDNLKDDYAIQQENNVYESISSVFKLVDKKYIDNQLKDICSKSAYESFEIRTIAYSKNSKRFRFVKHQFSTWIQSGRRYFGDRESDRELISVKKLKDIMLKQVLLVYSNNELLTNMEQLDWINFDNKGYQKFIKFDNLKQQIKRFENVKNF